MRPYTPLLFAALALAGGCPEKPANRPTDASLDRYIFQFPEGGDLLGPDSMPAGEDRCLGAKLIPLTGGKATVKGSTAGALNEFGSKIKCGETYAMAGPQRYFGLAMQKSRVYRLELKPDFDAVLYLFSECSQTLINVDCASGGATGIFSGPIPAKGTGGITFVAPASGTYRLAVDSVESAQEGSYELQVQEWTSPTHASCKGAKTLALKGGAASVSDSTLGALDELGSLLTCGLTATLDGPQLYYEVDLDAASWYRITLEPQFSATLYVAASAGGCLAANIETDCSGLTGTVLPLVPQGGQASTAFRPTVTGSYLVVVDSPDPKEAGPFDLEIKSFTPPEDMVCQGATPLLLPTTVAGDTSPHFNDLGALMSCNTGAPLVGPQTYYRVELEASKTYQVRLSPSFPAVLAVGGSCVTLPADCASSGASGDAVAVPAGTFGTLLVTAKTAGTHIVSVDGQSVTAAGAFTLQIAEHQAPTNGSCASPQVVALSASPTEVLGDTGPLKNDLGPVSCGTTAGPWPGPQAYYRLSLKAGTSYTVMLVPEATFDPALYAFVASTSCTATDVDTACTGLASDVVGAGAQESLVLSPATDMDYVVVVDSWSPSAVGSYALRVTWP